MDISKSWRFFLIFKYLSTIIKSGEKKLKPFNLQFNNESSLLIDFDVETLKIKIRNMVQQDDIDNLKHHMSNYVL